MIDYSIAIRNSHPMDPTCVDRKAYPVAQISDIMNIQQFADHIASHGSVYSRDIVAGVLSKAVDCLREMLLDGKKVELGDLGSFYVSLKSKGAPTAAEITAANIKEVNVVWSKSSYFQNLKKDAEFRLVATRQAQAEAVAEQKGNTPEPSPTPTEKKTVTVIGMPEGFGKVEGNGEYPEGSNVVVRAIPNLNYSFVGWSDGSKAPSRTIKLREDLDLIANFVAGSIDPTKLYITAVSKDTSKGRVTGSGAYKKGDMVTLTAIPQDGYTFNGWSDGKKVVSHDNPYEFEATDSATLIAQFVEE